MSKQSPEDAKLRHQIGVCTETVFWHSIALANGETHQEAADEIMRLVLLDRESYAQKKYQEGELSELRATNKWIVNSELDDASFHKWCMHYSEREKTLESQLERKEQ